MSEDDRADSDSVPPPDSPPGTERESRRRRLEGVIPEILRRAVELGVEKAQEAPDNLKQFVGDMKLPKDIAHYIFAQIDETKNGLFRVVAKELRDFLEHTNFAGEVQKLLTTVQFEVNTTIRFTPNDGKPKRRSSSQPPPEDADGAEAKDGGKTSERGTPLPRPEVKTNVHVTRDDRDVDSTARRSTKPRE